MYLHKAETKITLSAKAGILGVDFIINISSIYIINIPVFRKNESLILITGSETISCEEQHDETPIRISVNDFDVPYKDCLCWFRGLQL